MTRSRRKVPFISVTTAETDKPFKVSEHRKERRNARVVVRVTLDDADPRLHSKNYGDPWRGEKDGKMFWPEERTFRK